MIKPASITWNKKESYLEIVWNDNTVCRYPLSNLREACPCAECRGGHEFMGREYDPDDILQVIPARSYTMTDLKFVGSYALQPIWDDGHDSGIYAWEYLRRLCPKTVGNEAAI